MAPSRVVGGLSQTSPNSGIFFQGDVQSQKSIISHLTSQFGNSADSGFGTGRENLGSVSSDVNQTVLNSVVKSGSSVGASSLVTDANSSFSGVPRLQRSASINNESYLRIPASPMSYSSNNNISVSGSSVIDGVGPPLQQGFHHDPLSQQAIQQGISGSSSMSSSQAGQLPLGMGQRIPNCFMQDPTNLSQMQKKPRLDIKQEDILQQQVLQHLLQRQDPMQLQNHNPQLQAMLQQQRLRQQQQQQQQILQAMPQMQRVQLQQQQQQQLRQHLQQQSLQQLGGNMKNPYDTGGVCARRLMQYLYHQRQRPPENTIAYWRKFVSEYYAPRAKKRWCLSLYDNVGQHALGVFPQASMDAWHCDICGSNSGRGFEATFEVLPRLNEIKFGSGVIDELLFVDLPRERRFVNGLMMLEYGKAIQESVYEQLRIVREGQLRIVFTQELKILSWEFCARRHEELLPRKLVAPQVNQLLQVAQKCQSTLSDGGSEGDSSQDLQTNSNMVVTASRQLAKSLELPSLNDLGFSKRYVRCLQIAEVVNSMKDLIDFCRDNKVGPIDGLKRYPLHDSASKSQVQRMQEMEQVTSVQGLPNTIEKIMTVQPQPQQPGINNTMGNNQNTITNKRGGALSGPAAAALALSNYQSIMMRQNSMYSNPSSFQQEASSLINNSNQSPSSSYQDSMQNLPTGGGHLNPQMAAQPQHYQLQQQNPNNTTSLPQQMFQDMSGNSLNMGGHQKVPNAQSMSGSANITSTLSASGLGYGNNTTLTTTPPAQSTASVGGGGPTLSKSSSFKAASNSDSCALGGGTNSGLNNLKAPDLPQSIHLADDMVPDLPHDFSENGFFSSDLDDYAWK